LNAGRIFVELATELVTLEDALMILLTSKSQVDGDQ
jgi:hypothetical protein